MYALIAPQQIQKTSNKNIPIKIIPQLPTRYIPNISAATGTIVCLKYGQMTQTYELIDKYPKSFIAQQLSVNSPLGKSIVGKHVGDYIIVKTNYANFLFTILSITKI